jgi:hypothetical protein
LKTYRVTCIWLCGAAACVRCYCLIWQPSPAASPGFMAIRFFLVRPWTVCETHWGREHFNPPSQSVKPVENAITNFLVFFSASHTHTHTKPAWINHIV